MAVLRRTLTPLAPLGLAAALLLAVLAGSASAQGGAGEYEVKAAFLYNFAKFVEWPGSTFESPTDPLVLCVFGDDPFGESLDAVVQGETVGGRRLVVHRTRETAQLRGCHVVFLSQRTRERYPQVLDSLRGTSVLTVGEGEGFLTQGGMIRFVLDQNRVRFEINLDAAERNRLKLSSQLLRLARAVNPQSPRP
ncbi:MAG TPA: YfiR family protein [Thermoanaerobaculia bacterium]